MRKLASVRRIHGIQPIPNADAIECAMVDGWNVVIKKGEFSSGDLVIYFEIDSWIPHDLAPFLSKGEPKEYNDVKGERLKTVKLRGQISQGLVLPLNVIKDSEKLEEGQDLTEYLGIQKWESTSFSMSGVNSKPFPDFIPKTDQERVQNLRNKLFSEWSLRSIATWEVSEKLDGSSMTVFLDSETGKLRVCSRNIELEEDDSIFWKVAKKLNIESGFDAYKSMHYNSKFSTEPMNFAFQGELVGPGIQGNKYKLKDHEFLVFDVFDIDNEKYFSTGRKEYILSFFDEIKHVPILEYGFSLKDFYTIEAILKFSEGKSRINEKTEREGLVFKCNQDTNVSFKAISNQFLLKEK